MPYDRLPSHAERVDDLSVLAAVIRLVDDRATGCGSGCRSPADLERLHPVSSECPRPGRQGQQVAGSVQSIPGGADPAGAHTLSNLSG